MIKKIIQYSLGVVFVLGFFLVFGSQAYASVPQVVGVSLVTTDQIIINFSEPIAPSSATFSTSPLFTYTPVWSNNNMTVSLQHGTFSANQSYTITIGSGTDAITGLNSISNLPYIINVASGNLQTIATTAPSNTSISINSGTTITNSPNVTLGISAINAVSMRISNNPFFTDFNWETYAVSKNWTLSLGNGVKTIYAKFISSSGVESDPISVNITLDNSYNPTSTTPPEISAIAQTIPVVVVTPTISTEECAPGNLFNTITGQACAVNPNIPIITTIPPAMPPIGSGTTYNLGITTLREGSRGEAVKELQRFLNNTLNLGLVIDGILGPKTIAVIKKWQGDNDLVADGLVGPKTKAKMNALAQL